MPEQFLDVACFGPAQCRRLAGVSDEGEIPLSRGYLAKEER
jgi:hypothetical protein